MKVLFADCTYSLSPFLSLPFLSRGG